MKRVLAAISLLLVACATAGPKPKGAASARLAMAEKLRAYQDYDGMLAALEPLCRGPRPDPEALALRGAFYRDRGLFDEARADLEQALKIAPGLARVHDATAVLYDLKGAFDQAERHHARALELEPENAAYLNNYGYSLLVRARGRDAIPVLQHALRQEPQNARIRNNLGFAHAQAGDFTRAAQQFEVAGSPAQAKNNLAFAYELAGNAAQAYALYLEAIRLDPGMERARANLVYLAKKTDRKLPPELEPAAPPAGAAGGLQ